MRVRGIPHNLFLNDFLRSCFIQFFFISILVKGANLMLFSIPSGIFLLKVNNRTT